MKNQILNLGKVLSKTVQKEINGGFGYQPFMCDPDQPFVACKLREQCTLGSDGIWFCS
ncbi:conserved hypothetical protein [Tenacibaculum amylolyticum]